MKITEQKTEAVTKNVVTDTLCNLCGESCMDPTGPNNLGLEVKVSGGYGSAFPPDMTTWSFDLCELCLGFLVSKFKIFPDSTDGRLDNKRSKELLVDGKTDGFHEWVISRYEAAMSRRSLFESSKKISRK